MIILGKGFCVVLSLVGGAYCIWLLLDCWRQTPFRKKPTAPPPRSDRHGSVSTRTEWLCQLVLSVVAIWFAGMLVIAYGADAFRPIVQLSGISQRPTWESESASSVVDSLGLLHRDLSLVDRPVIGIDCATIQVSDEQIARLLRSAPELQCLNLIGTPITGQVLTELTHTPSLRDLVLSSTQIADDELVHLDGLANLRLLYLMNTKITDKGLVHLGGLTDLQTLNLTNTQVTDKGLVHLKGLTNLRDLNLTGTEVTDKGLVHLEGLANLRVLHLENTKITDKGLVYLGGLTNLQTLKLTGTKVTDKGREYLKKSRNLE